jgi:hypothetical protein
MPRPVNFHARAFESQVLVPQRLTDALPRIHSVPLPTSCPRTAELLAVKLAEPPPLALNSTQLQLAASSDRALAVAVATTSMATATAATVMNRTLNTISLSAAPDFLA